MMAMSQKRMDSLIVWTVPQKTPIGLCLRCKNKRTHWKTGIRLTSKSVDLAWSIRHEPNTFTEVCQPYPTVHLFGIRQNLRLLPVSWQLAHRDALVEEPSDPDLARNCLQVLIDGLPEVPSGTQR